MELLTKKRYLHAKTYQTFLKMIIKGKNAYANRISYFKTRILWRIDKVFIYSLLHSVTQMYFEYIYKFD